MLRAAALVEKLGIPTVSIIGSAFTKQAQVVSKGLGVPLAMGVYPGTPMVDSEAVLAQKVNEHLAPELLYGLTGKAPDQAPTEIEPLAGEIIMKSSLDEIQEHIYQKMWSDGMPNVTPTRERVQALLN